MTVRIVTDSTCDLPDSLKTQYEVTVVPAYINIDGQSFLDGVELTRSEFYDRLPTLKIPPTTSAPGIERFVETYKKLSGDNDSEIISIHAAGSLSNIFNVARLASEALETVKIAVVDSGSTSLGLGFQALIAAKAGSAGKSVPDIIELLQKRIKGTYLFAAVDTIDYLRRSGRVSNLQARLGSLLNIKPVLSLNNGRLRMETIRTRARSIEHIIDMVTNLGPLEYLAVAHTHAFVQAEQLCSRLKHIFPKKEKPFIAEATPALGAHVGPGTLGILCVTTDS